MEQPAGAQRQAFATARLRSAGEHHQRQGNQPEPMFQHGLPSLYFAAAADPVNTCNAADTYTKGAFQLIATSLLA